MVLHFIVLFMEIGGWTLTKRPGVLWPMTSWDYFGTQSQSQVVVLIQVTSKIFFKRLIPHPTIT